MTKDRALRDILQEIKTYEDTESKRSSLFESKKQKNIEELIFKVSNAYSYLCIIYPDFTEYNWNQDLGALLPNSNSISDLVENINSVAQEGKSFEKLLKLMHQLYFVHNIQEDVTTNVNINDLLDRAQHMKEIAQNMVDEGQPDTISILDELNSIKKQYKIGGLRQKIDLALPEEYSGYLSISARARLMFNGPAPIMIQDYIEKIANAYLWFGKNNLKTIKKYTGFPVRINDEDIQATNRAGVETFDALERAVGNHPKMDQIVSAVVRYVERLSKVNYSRTQRLQDVSKTVKKVIEWCDDPELMIQHLQEYKSIIDMIAKSRDRVAKVSYLTCRGY